MATAQLAEIRTRAREAFERLGDVLSAGTIEEKRELIGLYVQKIKADPDACSVQISLYPAMFTAVLAGVSYGANEIPALAGLSAWQQGASL